MYNNLYDDPDFGLESMLLYPQFYRNFGIRRAVQLVAPPLIPITRLSLPRSSLLHFVSDDEALYGIPQDNVLVKNSERLLMVQHIQELGDNKGTPRSTRLPVNTMVGEYHRKNRSTRKITNLETALRDPRTLIVENYALLPHLWRYPTSYFRSYYKWWNIQAAMWGQVQAMAHAGRQQYIECRLPKLLPSLMLLKRAEGQLSRTLLNAFAEPEALFILEVWKWLGPNRAESVLSKASLQALEQVNLLWIEGGFWSMINLGELNKWRAEGDDSTGGKLSPDQIQKRFLRMLMHLFETRTVPETAMLPEQAAGHEEAAPKSNENGIKISVPATDDQRGKTITLKPGMNVDNLPDEPVEETAENISKIDTAISEDLNALDHLHQDVDVAEDEEEAPAPVSGTPTIKYVPEERSFEKSVMDKVDNLADTGMISAAEFRRFTALSSAYQRIRNPYGEGTLADAVKIQPADLKLEKPKLPDIETVLDKSMLQSSLLDFDSGYIEKVLKKDVLNAALGIQHAGIAVTDYEVETVEDAMTSAEIHRVQLTPVEGRPTTVTFRIPKVEEDGTFRSGGVRYRMRKQRGDLPIRKLSPVKVALTSYFAKVFITRSEKQVHNYSGWLTNQIAAQGMDPSNDKVTHLMLSNVFDSNNKTPRIYAIMAARFRSFHTGPYEFFFDYEGREEYFGKALVEAVEKDGAVIIARSGKNAVVAGTDDVLYLVKGESLEPLGTMESVLGLSGRGPMEMNELKVLNKAVPVGMFLAYHMGLSQLLQLLKVNPRRVPTGERLNLSEDEYALRFEDEALVFSRDNKLVSPILAGIAVFEKAIRNYPVHLFDKRDIYLNVLEQNGIGVRYIREMELMNDLFIDPITEEILKDLNEPTDFIGLVLRACELLLTDWAPDETDMSQMRIKGYERIAGAVYGELVRAIRQQRSRGSAVKAKIELPPYAVWQAIQQDAAVKLVEDSNPIHNVKEKEEVTYTGTGGRSDRSMSKNTRVFHPNDMGVISEATKDSADVAITTFLTADPNLVSMRGVTRRYRPGEDGPTSLLSSSAMLAPAADRDDPKRVNFISIQQSSGTFAEGYRATPLRTGYEQVLAHRADDLYAYVAKGKGKITAVTPKSITVTYDDGKVKAVELGRRFGTAAGMTFPHMVVTDLKVGDTVEPGDTVCYNSHYFESDPLNPKQAVWKGGVLVKVAIMESVDTLEDSSAISERVAEQLTTHLTKVRDIVVSFDQVLHNVVQPGQAVDVESILCTIEDSVTAQNQLFDADSLDTLRLLSANTPRAKFKGTVEKVEVFYHGDLDDASESVAELAMASDRDRKRLAREMKTSYTSGQVNDSMRIDGRNLPQDHAVIRIYLTGPVKAGVGDKGVFANQMKTIFGRVMSGINRTESGEEIDAIFGYQSISDRIVQSPEIIGTTNTLLKVISKRVANVYRGNKQ